MINILIIIMVIIKRKNNNNKRKKEEAEKITIKERKKVMALLTRSKHKGFSPFTVMVSLENNQQQ